MHIIGINGFKQSGKGTTATLVEGLVTGVVKQVGFADKLKILAARTLGFSGPDRYLIDLMDEFKLTGRVESFVSLSEAKKAWFTELTSNITGRQFLQNLGNEARQIFGEDFWVNQVLPSRMEVDQFGDLALQAKGHSCDYLLLTDLRYPNEARRIHELGGVNWNIQRPGLESDGHDSEQPLPPNLIDFTLYNTNDIDHLVTEAALALEETC